MVRFFAVFLFLCVSWLFAEGDSASAVPGNIADSSMANVAEPADSSIAENPAAVNGLIRNDSVPVDTGPEIRTDMSLAAGADYKDEKPLWLLAMIWPFNHIVQPLFDAAVFPFAGPIHYAVKYKVMETAVDMFAFGKEKNIFIYPTMNLKPGASTLLGFAYRHRNMLQEKDYYYLSGNYYANGDWSMNTRYTKRNFLGTDLFVGGRFAYWQDRNASCVLPGGQKSFVYTDSSLSSFFRAGHPLPQIPNVNVEGGFGLNYYHEDLPDVEDSVLKSRTFNRYERGLYQNFYAVPFKLEIDYDNVDAPFVPTTGYRAGLSFTYINVSDYRGRNTSSISNDKDHDYMSMDFFAQRYIFMGTSKSPYLLSSAEARQNRKFYTDFSWDETLRLWRPENIQTTLMNRRVLAFQFRMRQMWEAEKGGAPHTAFPTINARYPLRGYSGTFADRATMGLSAEYRWPIDRLVDGVVFDEYAMYMPSLSELDAGTLLNSWGFGVRVRKPDMYFFRIQIGFHGLHGIGFICTIAPEFQ